MWNKETLHNFNLPQQANPLMENNHQNSKNLASINIKLVVELEDGSGNKFRVQLPFPRDIQYKSYDELMQMESQVNVDPQQDS